ncbi:MAG TPA: radical SAM protein [Sedimentisphaerales bacterium]|nr:radical SAM protein [Sedimentisphaerales bacterium]
MINISKLYCGLAGESDHLRYNKRNDFGPIAVFNCTKRCNLKCQHCYSSSDKSLNDVELNTDQAINLLDQLKEANCPVVLFSGGEPLLRGDLFELLEYAKKIGLRTVISTNGTLIDEKVAKKLAGVNIGYVGISLDGPKQLHDKFRCVKGCFDKTIAGFKNCQKFGIKAGLRFTITKANKDCVGEMFEIASDNGIRRICFYHLIGTGRAVEILSQSLTPEQTRTTIDTLLAKTSEFVGKGLIDEVLTVGNHADGPYLLVKMQQQGNSDFEKAKELLTINGGNKIGEKIACISWDGSVYADQFWRNYCLGNVTIKSFKDIWYSDSDPVLYRLHNKDKFAAEVCLSCRWFELCKGNYRFLGEDSSDENWFNEPKCYLCEEEITK